MAPSMIKKIMSPSLNAGLGVGVSVNAGLQVQASASASASLELGALNPFSVADDVISQKIIGIHDSQAARLDVDPLYKLVTNIVKSSTHIDQSLDIKRANKPVELVEDKVPESSFMPSYSTLKEIACQMTCKPFHASTAHESVVGILEKLRDYPWDAKAVIALTAFALDYGENWRLSLIKASNENALEVHVLRLGEAEKPNQPNNADLISTLVDRTLQLIDGIMHLEKLISNKTYSPKDVPALYKAPRDLYTYWAILSLLACATQMTELDWNIKSEVVGRLKIVLTQLRADLDEIYLQIDVIVDLIWRRDVFLSPSGILELLKALIFPHDTKQLEIFDNTAGELVNLEVLKTKNLLLFISGLANIEDEIVLLKSIHDSLTNDKDKQDYKILWVPVVEKGNEQEKNRFEKLKSEMPWYVVHYYSLIKGFKPLQELWNYQSKPIVVVTNPRGEVINKNALHMIFVWGIRAFPFREGDADKLSEHWNWFWTEAFKIHPTIEKWVTEEHKYVLFYGGTDIEWTQTFGSLVDDIKKDPIMKETETYIEHFNLGIADINMHYNFWANISNSFLSKTQKDNYVGDAVIKDIQTLLSMRNEKGWALLSKGENVLVVGHDELMLNVMQGFKDWGTNVLKLGFYDAFNEYYVSISANFPVRCRQFQLHNIRSSVPLGIECSEASCQLKMEIESVTYKCCHGIHFERLPENGEANAPVLKNN